MIYHFPNQHQVAVQGLVSPYARSGGTRMEPGIAETMLEGGRQYGARCVLLRFCGRDLMPLETMFQKGKSSKLFNL